MERFYFKEGLFFLVIVNNSNIDERFSCMENLEDCLVV